MLSFCLLSSFGFFLSFQGLSPSLHLFIKSSSIWFKQYTNACIISQEIYLSKIIIEVYYIFPDISLEYWWRVSALLVYALESPTSFPFTTVLQSHLRFQIGRGTLETLNCLIITSSWSSLDDQLCFYSAKYIHDQIYSNIFMSTMLDVGKSLVLYNALIILSTFSRVNRQKYPHDYWAIR